MDDFYIILLHSVILLSQECSAVLNLDIFPFYVLFMLSDFIVKWSPVSSVYSFHLLLFTWDGIHANICFLYLSFCLVFVSMLCSIVRGVNVVHS